MNIRKILYATDFSPCARQAFAPATSLARRCEAELHVFHAVVLYGQVPLDPMMYSPAPEGALAAAAAATEESLTALASSSCAAGARLVVAQQPALDPPPQSSTTPRRRGWTSSCWVPMVAAGRAGCCSAAWRRR